MCFYKTESVRKTTESSSPTSSGGDARKTSSQTDTPSRQPNGDLQSPATSRKLILETMKKYPVKILTNYVEKCGLSKFFSPVLLFFENPWQHLKLNLVFLYLCLFLTVYLDTNWLTNCLELNLIEFE